MHNDYREKKVIVVVKKKEVGKVEIKKNNNRKYANKDINYRKEEGTRNQFMTISSNDITLQDPTNNIEIELENKKQGSITGVNVGKEKDGSDGGSVSNVIGSGGGNMRSGKPFMGHK